MSVFYSIYMAGRDLRVWHTILVGSCFSSKLKYGSVSKNFEKKPNASVLPIEKV